MHKQENKRVRIRIDGKVQGVGFRFFTQRSACTLGIKGHVKNEADGSVTIEAEGETVQLEQFLRHVEKGPQWARVDAVTREELPSQGDDGFRVV
jgi:acylphosphatase